MADLLYSIKGRLSGGGGGGGSNPPTPPDNYYNDNSGGNRPVIPTYDRMTEDIRRAILSNGAFMVPGQSNLNQLTRTIIEQKKDEYNKSIDYEFDSRFEDLKSEKRLKKNAIEEEIDFRRQNELSKFTDPLHQYRINNQYDRELGASLRKLEREYEEKSDKLGEESSSKRERVSEDLEKVARELVEELKRGNSDSYLNKLRDQHSRAIWRRDNAETAEEASEAAREAAEIQGRISETMGGGGGRRRRDAMSILRGAGNLWGWGTVARTVFDYLQLPYKEQQSEINQLRAASNGDVFGAMMQDLEFRRNQSATWAATGGAVLGTAIGALALKSPSGAALGAGIGSSLFGQASNYIFDLNNAEEKNSYLAGQLVQDNAQKIAQYADFANILRQVNGGDNIKFALEDLLSQDDGKWRIGFNSGDIDVYDLGLTRSQFAEQARQRILQRGYSRGTIEEDISSTVDAIGLEKLYSMSPGSLGQLSAYDRYGNNANQDFANLVASLGEIGTRGMSNGQVFRANEFMGYQTQLMEMQKNWTLNPSSNFASQMLLTAQNIYGDSLDNRGIQRLGNMMQSVINPGEGIQKQILFDVAREKFGVTSLRDIAGIQYNPEKAWELTKARALRTAEIYGDETTERGWLELGGILGTYNPEEQAKIMSAIRSGDPKLVNGNIEDTLKKLAGYTPEPIQKSLELADKTTAKIFLDLNNDDWDKLFDKIYNKFDSKLKEIVESVKSIAK